MATIAIAQPRMIGHNSGRGVLLTGGIERPNVKETAAQTFDQGAPVYRDSNGTIALATASSNIVGELFGIAFEDASGTTGDTLLIRPIYPGDRYIMNVKGTSTLITALTMLGNKYMLDLDSGVLVVNPDASFDDTKPWVRVEELYTAASGFGEAPDVEGDTAGRLVVVFGNSSGLQAQ